MTRKIALLTMAAAGAANAQVLLFEGAGQDFQNLVSDKIECPEINFDNDADYGIVGIGGPLTSAGLPPVSPGILTDNIVMNSLDVGGNATNNLVAVGPSGGFGNPSNAILANTFVDQFEMTNDDPAKCAFQMNVLTLLGSSVVDITVTDTNGATFVFPGVTVGSGTQIGLASLDAGIASVRIFDPGNGAEGVQGTVRSWIVPAPSSLALLGLGGLAAARRRR